METHDRTTERQLLAIIDDAKEPGQSRTGFLRSKTGYGKLATYLEHGGSCTVRQANKVLHALDLPPLRSCQSCLLHIQTPRDAES